ncbi:hypothetical protein [Pseudomonas prosekii]|uniref:hypothetical protein n=1 Tax=Pseudomonas prosekii TaxID=1148509 RepID=UPI0011EB0B19|nr:hypothetical protein [Pseudomonas prosekii]
MQDLNGMERFAPGLATLSREDLAGLIVFTILWTLFEAQALSTNAALGRIVELAERWGRDGHLESRWHMPVFHYFKARYVENGQPTQHFENLFFHDEKSRAHTLATLGGNADGNAECLSASLLIVYRFRNDFFHGMKWAYDMKGQRDNFEHSSQLLVGALKVVQKLRHM